MNNSWKIELHKASIGIGGYEYRRMANMARPSFLVDDGGEEGSKSDIYIVRHTYSFTSPHIYRHFSIVDRTLMRQWEQSLLGKLGEQWIKWSEPDEQKINK